MVSKKRLIPLQKRVVYAGDVFNSLMAEKGWSVTEATDFVKVFQPVDVVEVVRCKDCTYWDKATVNKHGFLICPASGMDIMHDDFCSFGERKRQ